MAYTSNKLCHFVGRRFKTDLERINLLVNIIREGTLRTKQTGGKDFQSCNINFSLLKSLNPFCHNAFTVSLV